MSQLKTHLLAEDPVIVLIGNNTVLRSKIIEMLQKQKLQVLVFGSEDVAIGKVNPSSLENIYKIIWLYEKNSDKTNEYLKILSFLKDVRTPVIVITGLITALRSFNSDLLNGWKKRTLEQDQFIVDCNYHLPKASFVFGLNIFSFSTINTSMEFMLQGVQKGIIIDPSTNLSMLEFNDFVENLKEYLFKSGRQNSILIRGENSSSEKIVGLIKKLYDSYYKTNLEIIKDSAETGNPVPFSIKERVLGLDLRKIVAEIVKNLKFPSEIDTQKISVDKPDENLKNIATEDINNDIKPKEVEEISKELAGELAKELTEAPIEEPVKSDPVVTEVQKVDVDKEIQRIFQNSRAESKVNRIRKIAKDTKIITKKSGRKKIFFIGGIGVAGAAAATIILALIFFLSQLILRKELVAFISSEATSGEMILVENKGLERITNFVDLQASGYGSIIEVDPISKIASMVEISKGLQSIPQMLLEVDEASKNLFLQVIAGDANKTSELAQILDDKARTAYENLSGIQASLNLVEFDIDSEDKKIAVSEYESKLKEIRSTIAVQQQLQPILASLTGETSKKTYAVIFQNNQELRPTGGFIQAIALLNFDEGSLVSHDVYSVYELDEKLSGDIIPPSDIKNFLGEDKWYLRDSNWNPDFPVTSKQIGWFINKSLGTDIDGVIAINLFTTKDILEATGPVDLPEYNEIITYKNILERMEFHSEVILVDSPNSTDYSVAVFEKIIDKIIKIDREKVPSLLSSLEKSIGDNQLAISVEEESDQLVLHSLGWTGGLVKPNCPTQLSLVDCKVDAFSQVEANIGINKANYYLDRSISHKVTVDRKKAVHEREITFTNNAKSNSWPKGAYKSYQRFYIDKEAVIEKVLINGSALIEEQISQKEVSGFKEVGIRVDVPIQKQVVVRIEYSTPHDFKNGFSYVFFNKKQAGTSGDPLVVTLEYASDIEPVLISPTALVHERIIEFEADLNNSLFSVEFE